MIMHSDDRQSLKGSNKCSVWQRHTTMASRNFGQPERLQHNQCNRHNVAASQAAFMGVPIYPRRCHWAISVAAFQAACGVCVSIYPRRCHWAIPVAAFQAACGWDVSYTQGVAAGLHLFQPVGLGYRCNAN